MHEIKYFILDVFANNKYEGNQLAVFLDLENQLNSEDMLSIAKEINFAESTFIKQDLGSGKYDVRIFTPEYEVPFAGHPSLGTGYIISRFLDSEKRNNITLKLSDSEIDISIADPNNLSQAELFMKQSQPEFFDVYGHREFSKVINLNREDLIENLPIQEISTGLPYIIVPIKSLSVMENIALNTEKIIRFLKGIKKYKSNSESGLTTAIFFFTSETYEQGNNFNTRMFCVENDKMVEDAATGSANGCFLAYLLKYKSGSVSAKVEQGFQMKRNSYIHLEGSKNISDYNINIGGKVNLVSEGKWFI